MLSLAIDAHKARYADMDDKVIMLFEGGMVAYMIAINPEYEKYTHTTKKGKCILYVQLLRALYGCMQSALL